MVLFAFVLYMLRHELNVCQSNLGSSVPNTTAPSTAWQLAVNHIQPMKAAGQSAACRGAWQWRGRYVTHLYLPRHSCQSALRHASPRARIGSILSRSTLHWECTTIHNCRLVRCRIQRPMTAALSFQTIFMEVYKYKRSLLFIINA